MQYTIQELEAWIQQIVERSYINCISCSLRHEETEEFERELTERLLLLGIDLFNFVEVLDGMRYDPRLYRSVKFDNSRCISPEDFMEAVKRCTDWSKIMEVIKS